MKAIIEKAVENTSITRRRPKKNAKKTINEYTELHQAVTDGKLEKVKTLVNAGADINAGDRRGKTPLHLSIIKGDYEITKFFTDTIIKNSGKEKFVKALSTHNDNGIITLHRAIRSENSLIVNLIINNYMEILGEEGLISLLKAKNIYGDALSWAIRIKNIEITKILINKLEEISDKGTLLSVLKTNDNYGNLPIHTAVRANNIEMVKLLMEAGSDINAKNKNGLTALDLAMEKGYNDIASLLRGREMQKIVKEPDIKSMLLLCGNNTKTSPQSSTFMVPSPTKNTLDITPENKIIKDAITNISRNEQLGRGGV